MSEHRDSAARSPDDAAEPGPPRADEAGADSGGDDGAEAPAADPTYDEPGDNLLAAEDDDD